MAQQMSVLGIDIAKLVFHVVGMDDTGAVVLRKRIARSELLTFMANIPPLRMGMEACGSAHYHIPSDLVVDRGASTVRGACPFTFRVHPLPATPLVRK